MGIILSYLHSKNHTPKSRKKHEIIIVKILMGLDNKKCITTTKLRTDTV